MNISICICTYNRCDELDKTLQSLTMCEDELVDGDQILIIDNNSNDQTKEVVLGFKDRLPITYLFEAKQGLSAARNKGLSEFSNPVLVFIDDDITISKNFIKTYRQVFLTHPEYYFFGGPIAVDWGEKQPRWYKSEDLPMINGLIGSYSLGAQDKQYNSSSLLPYGANFAVRRQAIQSVGDFDVELGVNGKQIGRGEETDYFHRVLNKGFDGLYVANAKVFHRFQVERITLLYLYRYGLQKGTAAVLLDDARPKNTLFKVMHQLLAGVYQLMKLRVDRFYQCVINIGVFRGIYLTCITNKKGDS